ncbi:MAG: hypothetical protein HY683_03075 [Chloroflexi bacterium]|nr:hypothetical protein [Chloroflexota bacterium]
MSGDQLEKVIEEARANLNKLVEEVAKRREHPLLIFFYPARASINEDHIELLNDFMRGSGLSRSKPLDSLDVLIHTTGGEPTAAYRLAQVVRNFSKNVTFLVPEFAYSGGTLICLSGNDILLGDCAVLSPIDITEHRHHISPHSEEDDIPQFPDEAQVDEEVELVAIDHFINVATAARIDIEEEFRRRGWTTAVSRVESDMLVKMVEDFGVLEIAKLYREKNITRDYAKELLRKYMFSREEAADKIEGILRRLVVEAPAHEFPMDFHICDDVGLKVDEMDEGLSVATKEVVEHLTRMAQQRMICWRPKLGWFPYFQLMMYTVEPSEESSGTARLSSGEEAVHDEQGRDTDGQERQIVRGEAR